MMPIVTPKVPYRTPGEGTWQWVDLWNAMYQERVFFIGQNIDEEFSNQLLATMLYLDSLDDSKRIYMYINGPGGDVSSSESMFLQLNPSTSFLMLLTCCLYRVTFLLKSCFVCSLLPA